MLLIVNVGIDEYKLELDSKIIQNSKVLRRIFYRFNKIKNIEIKLKNSLSLIIMKAYNCSILEKTRIFNNFLEYIKLISKFQRKEFISNFFKCNFEFLLIMFKFFIYFEMNILTKIFTKIFCFYFRLNI
ncbi:hypothetical protein (nucleomorph) [Guillardia theta]|uniref:Uncharacterized protein n=1 Tax=Guillardia theta TaxID=55529 RepID=Q98RS8_GUITH|nr:hypothetical protein GTHECHR1077 [Guillardia theta]AAK39869.1 hypothetical protein [Guillardia theta]